MSAVSLGGGGIGQTWGQTSREEAVATVHAAVEAGVTLIDVAPSYGSGEAERVLGDAFGGQPPAGVQISTKCALFMPWSPWRDGLEEHQRAPDQIVAAIEDSFAASLARLKLERVDILFLHDLIQPDLADAARLGIWHSLFAHVVRPHFERLLAQGRIGAWGLTALGASAWREAAAGVDQEVIRTFDENPPPHAAQIEVNMLYSPGVLRSSAADPGPKEQITAAGARAIGVMGIRPTRGGALTDAFDRDISADSPEMAHYRRAAPFRALARELGQTPALLAHRYALTIAGVGTVTLGAKNRIELRECLQAEAQGPLEPELIERIDTALTSQTR